MTELMAIRLYFPLSARAKATRFWHRLSAPALGQHLLHCARRAHVQQAVMYRVEAGYLPGDRMGHAHVETTSSRLPQCIELVDTETRLRKYLHDHAEELKKVRVVLYRIELPLAA